MLRILRRPKWVIFTLLVPVGMALCLLAANWQYGRHVTRSALDARIRASAAEPAAPLADLAPAGAPLNPAVEYRTADVRGTFDATRQVLVRKRVLDGAAGFWVAAPLTTERGEQVWVLRGWTPVGEDARTSPPVPAPPAGEVTVTGWLQASQDGPAEQPSDLPAGQVLALDTAALSAGAPHVSPFLVQTAIDPPDDSGLTPVPVSPPGLGPHLGYSWQWLFFAALLPVGWVILLRRETVAERQEASAAALDGDPTTAR